MGQRSVQDRARVAERESSMQPGAGPSARGLVMWGLGAPAPLEHVLGFTGAADTVAAVPCSRFWAAVAASDAVWAEKCQVLWHDKVHVPARFRAPEPGGMSRLAAYWGSLADARRAAITAEELCSLEWSIRMKGWAGPDWTSSDPWWQGRPAAWRRYHPDGGLQSASGSGGHWRFVADSSGRTGPEGSFIRHSRGGRDYPTHFASRWPKNWGWILQNCWGFSASFPLPPRGAEPELEDAGPVCQSVTVETCRDEAMRFNMGLPLPYEVRAQDGTDTDGEAAAGDEDGEGLVAVLVNGAEQRLPASLVAALISAYQRLNEEEDEEEAPAVMKKPAARAAGVQKDIVKASPRGKAKAKAVMRKPAAK
mmetsp:Transcript_114806/g.371032  ORF Transcript_114806/g.371032 Transcript_114806/m.371032 type:complete len:365 (-) Transcript_114806:272-1366(-)